MIERTEKNYISPAMEVMTIEVEQAILNGSGDTEQLERSLDDLYW